MQNTVNDCDEIFCDILCSDNLNKYSKCCCYKDNFKCWHNCKYGDDALKFFGNLDNSDLKESDDPRNMIKNCKKHKPGHESVTCYRSRDNSMKKDDKCGHITNDSFSWFKSVKSENFYSNETCHDDLTDSRMPEYKNCKNYSKYKPDTRKYNKHLKRNGKILNGNSKDKILNDKILNNKILKTNSNLKINPIENNQKNILGIKSFDDSNSYFILLCPFFLILIFLFIFLYKRKIITKAVKRVAQLFR